MRLYKNGLASALAVARLVLPSAIVVGTLYLSTLLPDVEFDAAYLVLAVLAAMLTVIMVNGLFAEELTPTNRTVVYGRLLASWFVIVALLLLLGFVAKMSGYFSRRAFVAWFFMGGAGLLVAHHWVQLTARRVMSRPEMARRVVIAGINEVSVRLMNELEKHPELGLTFCGFFEDRSRDRTPKAFDGTPKGMLKELPAYVSQHGIDVVFVALPIKHVERVVKLLDQLHDTTVSIYFVPDVFVFDLIQSRVQSICGVPAIALCETPFHGYQGLLKRAMDLVLASAGLVVLSPVLLLVALAIKVTSPGSVIFKQRRYGLDGREIAVYKFRTMRVSDDGAVVAQAQRGDPRLTPIGGFLRRTSIDELPQLVNVVQGRMSLVGPRPHAVAHNEEYRKLIKGYMFRHKVLPGITGWAQVNGFRGGTERLEDMQGRVDYDLDYLRNWSLAFDLKIIFMTLFRLRSEKAY